ncbi:hypothetical protein M422DRAFT_252017 [Sphaerobolus stellatus SS14]|uniref:Uncharacterized protein n=1 Tax=Sphaerobolus stellatus (strain SS14) TaxID=990650 RepID=A0A0C9VQ83_SPHS4|nr:hypothetical protein M422DRAFT_252017 [Sphaerobolus stellatus SS14]
MSVDNRLYRILISESAHLIWRMRCEWRISGEGQPEKHITPNEVTHRWYKTIGLRALQDVLSANTARYGKKAVRKEMVDSTWEKLLGVDNFWRWNLEEVIEFLVGIPPGQPPGVARA